MRQEAACFTQTCSTKDLRVDDEDVGNSEERGETCSDFDRDRAAPLGDAKIAESEEEGRSRLSESCDGAACLSMVSANPILLLTMMLQVGNE